MIVVMSPAISDAAPAPRSFKNCTEMNKMFPHGVARVGATDKTTGSKVTNFVVKPKWYQLNKSKDRDGDGVACEKK